MLKTATKFVLDLVLKNETIQKFPAEMLEASAQWVRSWFLTDEDPATTAVLQSPEATVAAKQEAIEKKTEILLGNPDFRRELEEHLRIAGIRVENSENVLIGNTIHAQNVYVGHSGQAHGGGALPHADNLTTMERQAAEERLALLVQKRQAIQRGYDLEGDAGRQFAYKQQLDQLDAEIAQVKNQLAI